MDESQKKAPKPTRVRRMLEVAQDRRSDACILQQSGKNLSNSDHLLMLIAFEIFLKAVHLAHRGDYSKEHNYPKLFGCLPEEVQSEMKAQYKKILDGIESDDSVPSEVTTNPDLTSLLVTFHEHFVDLRYPYELTQSKSDEELQRDGRNWVDKGAPLAGADTVYHALELEGLCDALEQLLDTWLDEQPETP